MAPKQKAKFQTKVIKLGREKVTLYSLDGLTWSSRPNELEEIRARHEAARVTFAQIKGEVKAAASREEAGESGAEQAPPSREDGPLEVLSPEEREVLADDTDDEEKIADDVETEARPRARVAAAAKLPKKPLKPAAARSHAKPVAKSAKTQKGKKPAQSKPRRAA